ncbi:MAG: hypothetical protein B6230_01670 [Desulfobacteraceae bacterium 4572_89]|nr:MAG: hypothetical protein B6230_01670 [Desulfobacteraceae bacterium 4572_89]
MEIQPAGKNMAASKNLSNASATTEIKNFEKMLLASIPDPGKEDLSKPVLLGTITKDMSTVSELLYNSPLKKDCWNIIHDKINSNKAFNRIRPGTEIHYDPQTKELLWGDSLKKSLSDKLPEIKVVGQGENIADQGNEILSKAVTRFIGRDYEEMDCYELLVGGLTDLGVKYQGKNGLGRHLMNQAISKGLPRYHYMNGEGLVSESGVDVFKKTIFKVKNAQKQAENVMDEMKRKLKEGQVLSFSMRNRGHTGIISKKQGQWTFINSGKMDNNITGENGIKAVGEEGLKEELENWFQLAMEESQGLKITLGTLDLNRLSMFFPRSISQKV